MTRELSILQALAPARVGGLESVVGMLAEGLASRGHDVQVAAVVEPERPDHDEFLESLRRAGVPALRLAVPHRAYVTEVGRLRGVFAHVEPDVVHTHGYRGDVVAGTVARWGGYPVVSTVHGFTGGDWRNRFYEWLQRLLLRNHNAVIAVADPIRKQLASSGVDDTRLHLVRNAWASSGPLLDRPAARGRLGLPAEAFVTGWVGRLTQEKGPDVFLEAVDRLIRQEEDLIASIVGEGNQVDELVALVSERRMGNRVRRHGRVPGAWRLYRAFDVFVLSSRTEGTPVSLLEAMAAEVPIVATRVGGVPDVIRHEEEGLLVAPDDPAALARAIRAVRRDPATAGRRARRARERLETEFALEPWMERYEEIYRRVTDAS